MELLRGAGIAMEDIFKNLNADDAIKQFIKIGIQGDSLVNILGLCGMNADDAAKKVAELGSSGVKSTSKLGTAFVNLASKIGISTKALGLTSIGIVAAVTAVAIAVKKHHEGLIESAHEAAQSYREESDSLSEYGSRISELKKSLESEGISSSEEYNIRAQLLDIQNELITAYGSEAAALDLLTSSADDATAAYERFAAAQSKESASKNLTENASIIEKSIEAMEKVRTYTIRDVNLSALPQEATKSILDVISKYDAITYDRQDRMIRIEADASEAQEELYAFAEDMRVLERQFAADGIDIGEAAISWVYDDSWSKAIESQLSKVNEVIDEYGSIYDEAIVWKIASEGYTDINNEAKSYNSLMSDITDAQNDFQDAIISSYDSEEDRVEAVEAAMERINELKSQFGAIAFAEDDLGVRDYFQNMFEQMESVLEKEQLRIDIAATVNGEDPSIAAQNIVDSVNKFANGRGVVNELDIRMAGQGVSSAIAANGGVMSTEIWNGLSEQERMYWMLQNSANAYGTTVDDILSTMVSLGVISSDVGDAMSSALESSSTGAEALRNILSTLWSSESFANTKDKLVEMTDTITGITPENIKELAEESDELADILELDGMNAEFLANILQEVATGSDGFALITDNALRLNEALEGVAGSFSKVTDAKSKYDAAMSAPEKDTNFKSYAEAFSALNAEIAAGTTNSNAFWAAAEFLFGEEQLDAWGWADGLDQIKQSLQDNTVLFQDAESAGIGFLDRLYTMADDAGNVFDENGNKIASIAKALDGSYEFDFFGKDSFAKIADVMNISEEAAMACVEALQMLGDIDFYNIEEVASAVRETDYAAETLGGTAVNVEKFDEQLRALRKNAAEIADIKSDLQGLGFTMVDLSGSADTTIESLKSLGIAADDGVKVAVNYDALAGMLSGIGATKEEAVNLINELSTLSNVDIDLPAALQALENYKFPDTSDGFEETENSANSAANAVQNLHNKMVDLDGCEVEATVNVKANIPKIVQDLLNGNVGLGDKTKNNGGGANTSPVAVAINATGTKHASAGPSLLGDEYSPDGSPKPELVVSDDHAYIAGLDGPEVGYLNEGDVVYTADQTRKILRGSRKGVSPIMPAYSKGRLINGVNFDSGDTNLFAIAGGGPSSYTTVVATGNTGGTGGNNTGASGVDVSPENLVSTFEDIYKEHQHLRAMDKESLEDYLDWLEGAYKAAYENGEIELDDFRKYEEEVYEGRKDLFDDYLKDTEHTIGILENEGADSAQIINLYKEMMSAIDTEIANAKARGLTDNDEYVQELQNQWWDYKDSIADIEQEALEASRDAFKDHLSDTEHQIGILGQTSGNESQIIGLYRGLMNDIEKELASAKASGLDSNDEYVQELESQWWDYKNSIADMEEEALEASRDKFQDYLNDTEHQIKILQHSDGNESQIINLYQNMMDAVQRELDAAKASGLDSNDDYVQELESQWWEYKDAVAEMEEQALEESRDRFQDYLSDIEHQIDILGRSDGNDTQIINLYQDMMNSISDEMERAKASGLDSNDDYVQELEKQWHDYADQIKSIQEDSKDDAIGALEELIDFRIDMLKQDINDEKDALNERLSVLKDFYDEQKQLLQDKYDEEKYLEEQAEKRRTKSDIEAEMASLRRDDSAWAQKRLLELQEELNEAEKDLASFEKDHALENATDLLDKMYEKQAESIELQIEALDAKLNDPKALYNQALVDIRNNTADLFYAMVGFNDKHGDGKQETVEEMWSNAANAFDKYFSIFSEHYKGIVLTSIPGISSVGYASGTGSATPGLHKVNERGAEAIFTSADGSKYRLFSGGEKVLNADATNFLCNFANTGRSILSKIFDGITNLKDLGRVNRSARLIEIKAGDINISGNADQRTVSEIRRAQRENIDYILKEFNRLNR